MNNDELKLMYTSVFQKLIEKNFIEFNIIYNLFLLIFDENKTLDDLYRYLIIDNKKFIEIIFEKKETKLIKNQLNYTDIVCHKNLKIENPINPVFYLTKKIKDDVKKGINIIAAADLETSILEPYTDELFLNDIFKEVYDDKSAKNQEIKKEFFYNNILKISESQSDQISSLEKMIATKIISDKNQQDQENIELNKKNEDKMSRFLNIQNKEIIKKNKDQGKDQLQNKNVQFINDFVPISASFSIGDPDQNQLNFNRFYKMEAVSSTDSMQDVIIKSDQMMFEFITGLVLFANQVVEDINSKIMDEIMDFENSAITDFDQLQEEEEEELYDLEQLIQSDTIQSDTIQSDTIQSDTIQSDTIQSDTIQSDNENNKDYKFRNYVSQKRGPYKVIVYMHNLSKFDGIFIVKTILRNREKYESFFEAKLNKFFNYVMIKNGIVKIQIGSLFFQDSFLIIPMALRKIVPDLVPGKQKNDYSFENWNTIKKYNLVLSNPIELKKLKKYNLADSLLLKKSMLAVQKDFNKSESIDISDYLTTPSLGLGYFLKKYYRFKISFNTFLKKISRNKKTKYKLMKSNYHVGLKNHDQAIFITKPYLDPLIREALFGGRCELIKPDIASGYSFDINSLYPFASTSMLPYGSPIYIKNITTIKKVDFEKINGFFKIEWVSPPINKEKQILPVLPRRHPEKYNVYALGSSVGWFYSAEVKLALKMGYKIKVLEYIKFVGKPGYKAMVSKLYKYRTKFPKGSPLNTIAKLILNGFCYGKSAINPFTVKSKIFFDKKDDNKELTQFIRNNIIKSVSKNFKNNFIIVLYIEGFSKKNLNKIISNKIANFSNLDHNEVFLKLKKMGSFKKSSSCVHIGAAVTSQARVSMYPFLQYCYEKKMLAYTDTDSIFLETKDMLTYEDKFNYQKLNNQDKIKYPLKHPILQKRLDRDKLGFFKIESVIIEAHFAAQKIYSCLTIKDDNLNIINKLKGIPSKYIQKDTIDNEFIEQIDNEFIEPEENHDLDYNSDMEYYYNSDSDIEYIPFKDSNNLEKTPIIFFDSDSDEYILSEDYPELKNSEAQNAQKDKKIEKKKDINDKEIFLLEDNHYWVRKTNINYQSNINSELNKTLFDQIKNQKESGKPFFQLKPVPVSNKITRTISNLSINSKEIKNISISGENQNRYRKNIYSNENDPTKPKKWIGTESWIYDVDFQIMSEIELEKAYNNFISNII